ncbi:non-ribosomal peptide synthetase [Bacillus pseudomycoides]|uniref:non-ribosomal peptide synthetase n=1 Tax=Bacillus pseudomycoides TaxID=64104 RepID=UPI000BEBA548|nr:non-ribosomal peptide synthetase [Bacillus pseudomycoides]PDZ70799.1 hypothetical protein CON58_26905 [Bacillus pseudomycoides]
MLRTDKSSLLTNKHKRYWLQKIGESEQVSRIMYDNNVNQLEQNKSVLTYTFTPSLLAKIKRITKDSQMGTYLILLSTYHLLLYKYTKCKNSIVWTSSLQNYPNPTCLFTSYNLSEQIPFKQLVAGLNKEVIEVNANSGIDVRNLVEDFSIKNFLSLSNICTDAHEFAKQAELAFIFKETDLELSVEIHYNNSLYLEETINRIFSQFNTMLEQVLQDSSLCIDDIKLLNDEEAESLISAFNSLNKTYTDLDSKPIHRIFEKQAILTPNQIAIKDIYGEITYKKLNEKANQVSYYLLGKGVQPEDIVAVKLPPSIETFTIILGIIKAGCAYLPILEETPISRIEYMLNDSKAKILFTMNDLEIHFQGLKIILTANMFEKESITNPSIHISANNLIYVMYTSGTTGEPKGVLVEHRNVYNTLYSLQKQYPLDHDDVFLWKTSYTFDVSVSELFGWFWSGGKLAILESENRKEPKKIIKFIEEYQVTHINFTPTLLSLLLNQVDNKQLRILDNLKYIFVAGEIFDEFLAGKVVELLPNVSVINLYGPTETAIYSTYFHVKENSHNTPIGKPISNMKAYVLDEKLNVQPIGVPGILYLAGEGVARGYLNKEKLTKQRFISDIRNSDKRMYLTGDIVRWLPDGNIEYIGRQDNQIKLRGFRIELGEIENCLKKHESILDAVVLVSNHDNEAEKYIYAYVISDSLTEEEIKDYLKSHLMDYMVPSFVRKSKEFPLTPSGKIDRKLLSTISINMRDNNLKQKPITPSEKELAQLWSKILNIKDIFKSDNFFDLGGHSLSILELISNIERKFNLEIVPKDIYSNPILSDLAILIENRKNFNKHTNNHFLENQLNKTFKKNFYIKKLTNNNKIINILFSEIPKDEVRIFIKKNIENDHKPHFIIESNINYIKTLDDYEILQLLNSSLKDEFEFSKLKDIVEEQYQLIDKSLKSSYVVNTFDCGVLQYAYFECDFQAIMAHEISINDATDESVLKRAIISVINHNEVFLCNIQKSQDNYLFEQHAALNDLAINTLDLSQYSLATGSEVLGKLKVEAINALKEKNRLDTSLINVLLVKMNEKDYKVIFVVNHYIFDADSKKILEYDLFNFLKLHLDNNQSVIPKSKSQTYQKYIELLREHTNTETVKSFINSQYYSKFREQSYLLEKEFPNFNSPIILSNPYAISFICPAGPNKNLTLFERNESYALFIAVQASCAIFNRDSIPIRILANGRSFANQNFYSVIGDCHTNYPVLFNKNYNNILDYYKKFEEIQNTFSKNNWNLLSLCSFNNSTEVKELKTVTERVINFNYIGEVSPEDEKHILSNLQHANYARFPIMAYSVGDKIGLVLFNGVTEEAKRKLKNIINTF